MWIRKPACYVAGEQILAASKRPSRQHTAPELHSTLSLASKAQEALSAAGTHRKAKAARGPEYLVSAPNATRHDGDMVICTVARVVSRLSLLLLCLLVAACSTSLLAAQSNEAEILQQLKDKPLFLRGCWKGTTLTFDHAGAPSQHYPAQSFTLCGVDVTHVHLGPDGLKIQGERAGLELTGTAGEIRLRLHSRINLHIQGTAGDDFGPALENVFAPNLTAIVPSREDYWRAVGERFLLLAGGASTPAPASAAASSAGASTKASHIGGQVRPPVLVSMADPLVPEEARKLAYAGKVEVYLWVETDGRPSHLEVRKAAGLGLDEAALAAVAQYRFKPATENGIPRRVDLYVDVAFQS